jgi:hypothetical protein
MYQHEELQLIDEAPGILLDRSMPGHIERWQDHAW